MSALEHNTGGQTGWFRRKRHTAGHSNGIRLALTLAAVAGTALGIHAILKEPAAEAGGTAILVGALLLLLVALAGKLPDRMSGTNWEIEFRPDNLREILNLIQSESPDLADKVEALVKSGARHSDAAAGVLASVSADRKAEQSFEDSARAAIRNLPGLTSLAEDVDVPVPGKGRPPKVDLRGDLDNVRVVFEIKGTWTPSVRDITERRIGRALGADSVDAAVLVVREEHLTDARSLFDDERVVVVEPREIGAIPERLHPQTQESTRSS